MKNYKMIIKGYDFGPYVEKIVIDWGEMLDLPKPGDFTLHVRKQGNFFNETPEIEGNREIIGSYMEGSDLILELDVHPSCNLGNALSVSKLEKGPGKFYIGNGWSKPYDYRLTYKGEDCRLKLIGVEKEIADLFESGAFVAADGIRLQYAYFAPAEAKNSKRPLIIWLHGAGEGSYFETQPADIAIIGNKVVAFADSPMQELIGGAFVLAPQTSTMWMDNGEGAYTQDGTSKYGEALAELIESFIDTNPSIDAKRVYIGGCSNGGFMTMKMLFMRPNLFAAAFPVCQGYKPEWVTDEMINQIKHIPIWQIHAKNDGLLPYTIAEETHKRLLDAGAKDPNITVFENMVSLCGNWKDKDGNPWEYDGHWSWIHAFNNDVKNDKTSLFEWLAMQVQK